MSEILQLTCDLIARPSITPDDAGMSDDDLARYREGNEEDPSQAALAFGEDYDLTLVGPWV